MSDSHPHADTGEALSAHVRAEIDHWLTKFPSDRRRSAVIAALHLSLIHISEPTRPY